jgi:hypothetical protein
MAKTVDMFLAICYIMSCKLQEEETMRLAEKLQQLRSLEGTVRGLGRAMTKSEMVRAMKLELGESISHPYLCQLEGGSRVHMTAGTRERLARFFKVLPGYLVDDPEGYQTALRTELPARPNGLRGWLVSLAESLVEEPLLAHLLFKLSRAEDPERYIILLDRLLELPPVELERIQESLDGRVP